MSDNETALAEVGGVVGVRDWQMKHIEDQRSKARSLRGEKAAMEDHPTDSDPLIDGAYARQRSLQQVFDVVDHFLPAVGGDFKDAIAGQKTPVDL